MAGPDEELVTGNRSFASTLNEEADSIERELALLEDALERGGGSVPGDVGDTITDLLRRLSDLEAAVTRLETAYRNVATTEQVNAANVRGNTLRTAITNLTTRINNLPVVGTFEAPDPGETPTAQTVNLGALAAAETALTALNARLDAALVTLATKLDADDADVANFLTNAQFTELIGPVNSNLNNAETQQSFVDGQLQNVLDRAHGHGVITAVSDIGYTGSTFAGQGTVTRITRVSTVLAAGPARV